MRKFSRRLFLKYISLVGGSWLGFFFSPWRARGDRATSIPSIDSTQKIPSLKAAEGRSRVVLVQDQAVFKEDRSISEQRLAAMLDKGMLRLTGESTSEQAWRSLFKTDDVVGIKVNTLGGRAIATHWEVVNAIASCLVRIGIPENNIIIWDRLTRELEGAGYTINTFRQGVRCFGTDTAYESAPEIVGSIGSCFSTIVSSACTALINVPVLKDHDLAGVSLSLKNFYGAIHNPNKYHDKNCDPYIADVNSHPYIKDKLRLVILDGLTMQYQGGPAFKPQWNLSYGGLLLSRDPVAIDRIGTELIEEIRKEKGLPTLKEAGREPVHILTAGKKGLGVSERENIELVRG